MPSIFTFHRAARPAAALMLAFGAFAPWAAQAQDAVPAMQSQGVGRFVCGGIGSDESGAMRAAMKQHPLSLLFARPDGGYLADVDVAVKDGSGAAVMTLRASGPVCLLDVPAGSYSVHATSNGVTKAQNATVGGAPKTLDFRF
ncbi:MAG: carboxypeptidase regulatory-like domain-containing protein [Pseudomonadota bacterium]